MASSTLRRRRLVLHLDVNRTLIQTDIAGGKTLPDVLNANVCSRVAGTVDMERKAWSPLPNADPRVPYTKTGPNELFYDEFVDQVLCPRPAEMAKLPPTEADALWKKVSKRRRDLKHAFTGEGGPGTQFRPAFAELESAMTSPSGDPWYIIPSFFHLVNTLSTMEWPFTILFRTFGHDLPPIVQEWANFVKGAHPHFKPEGPLLAEAKASLEDLATLRRWCPCANLHRCSEGMFLFGWPDDTDGHQPMPAAPINVDFRTHYSTHGATGGTSMTNRSLAEWVLRLAEADGVPSAGPRGVACAGLVDYYPWWASHAENGCAGKAFPLLASDRSTRQVFLDDNIRWNEPSGRNIVDFRWIDDDDNDDNARVVGSSPAAAAFLATVDPWAAITKQTYFFDVVLQLVQRQEALDDDQLRV